jgi:2Fe-2S ferredoxin
MTKITFIARDGTEYVREASEGTSLMRVGVDTDVPNIKAECGGAAACATCQVRLDAAWVDKVPAPEDLETSMLDEEDLVANVRLSCQIEVKPELDGLVVHLQG